MNELISWTIAHSGDIYTAVTSLIVAAAAITALTPSPKDDGVVKKIRDILDKVAFNFGFAKNKE